VQSFDKTQNSFNIDVANNMIDDASDKTFEQFQNLKMIAGEKNVSKRKKGKTIFPGITNSKMNFSGSNISNSKSRSRSRSPPYGRTENKDNYGLANTPAPMKNMSPKNYNLAGTKIIPKRVRSQTASGAGRTQAIPSRKFFQRKQ